MMASSSATTTRPAFGVEVIPNELREREVTLAALAQLIARASALRIPVAPVNDGKRVLEHPHLIERGVYVEDPSGGFQRPDGVFGPELDAVVAFVQLCAALRRLHDVGILLDGEHA